MNENPFSEPEDSDRTILRVTGGTRASPANAPPGTPPNSPPNLPPTAAPSAADFAAAPPIARSADATQSFRTGSAKRAPQRLAGEADALPKVGRSPMLAAAAPILDLIARIGSGPHAAQVSNGEELRNRAIAELKSFEAECRAAQVSDEQLRAGHYALCAALDDTALATPWGQSSGWSGSTLSSVFHQDVRSGERFFDLLSGMQQEPGRYLPALEICYFCLSLGLKGRYRLDSRGAAEIERIRAGLYQVLTRLGGPWERELSPHWRGVDAPHRGPSRQLPAWFFAAAALALLGLAYVAVSIWINSSADQAQLRLTQLPPTAPPNIQRASVPLPVATVQVPGVLEKFRAFLAPEIAQGLVEVQGDAQRVLVRISGQGMFDSGSPDLAPKFSAILGRVGEALRTEAGRVNVLGHSDNQPIRTVRWPSNFQLSAARAESAMFLLVAAAGQAERFSAVGRADTEPVASNDTEAGRDRNRRIEVVLNTGGVR